MPALTFSTQHRQRPDAPERAIDPAVTIAETVGHDAETAGHDDPKSTWSRRAGTAGRDAEIGGHVGPKYARSHQGCGS